MKLHLMNYSNPVKVNRHRIDTLNNGNDLNSPKIHRNVLMLDFEAVLVNMSLVCGCKSAKFLSI